MIDFYRSLVSYEDRDVKAEYDRWTRKWTDAKIPLPSNPAASLEHCDECFYPAIYRYLKLFCCIPTTTAAPERTFSTLKILKSYLRSTSTDERLNGLTQMYTHRSQTIDIERAIDRFAAKKRRADFVL